MQLAQPKKRLEMCEFPASNINTIYKKMCQKERRPWSEKWGLEIVSVQKHLMELCWIRNYETSHENEDRQQASGKITKPSRHVV